MKRCHGSQNASDERPVKRQAMTSLSVLPRSQFENAFPKYNPQKIGHFSVDEQRSFHHDDSQLRFFFQPQISEIKCGNRTSKDVTDDKSMPVSLNLRDGYKKFIERDENIKERLDDLLRWMLLHKDMFNEKSHERSPMDFVCWRGLLTKILCTPYENREEWKIAAARYKGCIYLCEYDTQQKIENKRQEGVLQKEMSYWGFKFEQYVTTNVKDGQPDTDKPVNNNEAFVSVVRTHLNNHSLVFGGEVDCSDGDEYIELKTSRIMNEPKHVINFKRFKMIKWWLQSFLIGISKIICGFRDDDGIVKYLKTFKTNEIPTYCKDIRDCWKGTVCFNFCDEFLKFVRNSIELDYDKGIYVYEWMPNHSVSCKVMEPDSEYAFLPRWYTTKFECNMVDGASPPPCSDVLSKTDRMSTRQ